MGKWSEVKRNKSQHEMRLLVSVGWWKREKPTYRAASHHHATIESRPVIRREKGEEKKNETSLLNNGTHVIDTGNVNASFLIDQ